LCTAGQTKPDAKETFVDARKRFTRDAEVSGRLEGDFTRRTAFAPALPSPLRKTAPYGLPVHRLGDRAGRSPGSRVVAQMRPAFPVAQWPYGRELSAHSCGGSHG